MTTNKALLEVAELDLIDLESVRRFAEPWRAGDRTLDLLVNNAGIGASRHLLSPQGIESSWATNVVGHFALTALLFDRLTADARIVHVGSNLYKRIAVELPLEEIAAARRFSATKSYVASKLANILFGDELDRRLRAAGSSMRSLTAHPGVANTPMQTDREKLSERLIGTVIGAAFGRPPEAAAVALLYAATAPNAPTGLFLGPSLRRRDARVHAEPPKPPADDRALAARLWTRLEAQSGTTIQLDRVAQRAQTANAEGGLSPRSSSGRAA